MLLLTIPVITALSQTAEQISPLPQIKRLDSRDVIFKQYLTDVESSRRILYSTRRSTADPYGEIVSSLTIYAYIPGEEDELLGISARCNIPYGTLASLNRFSHMDDLASGNAILLSSTPGIFIPENPG